MSSPLRLFWLLSLLLFVSSCSGYRKIGSEVNNEVGVAQEEVSSVKPGATVRISTKNGETLEGRVLEVTNNSIVLREDAEPHKHHEAQFVEIVKLEVKESRTIQSVVGVSVIVVGFLGLVYLSMRKSEF